MPAAEGDGRDDQQHERDEREQQPVHAPETEAHDPFECVRGRDPRLGEALRGRRRFRAAALPFGCQQGRIGHAGLKTGEDGPTHADPQPLQLLQDNFPRGTMITLTPWDPQEIWPLFSAALAKRPAVIAPFVTRPNEQVVDRAQLGLEPVESAVQGMYLLRRPRGQGTGTIVLDRKSVV
jgi:transketolase